MTPVETKDGSAEFGAAPNTNASGASSTPPASSGGMMKPAIIVIAILAVIVIGAHFADKATRLPKTTAASLTKTESKDEAKPEPELTLKDLDGKDVSLESLKGKVVLVNFWATWCEPCKSEIPMLIGLREKYSPRGFEILGLSMDEDGKKAVQPFLDKERFDVGGQKEAINYPIAFANDTVAEKFGGVIGLPTSLLFTR